MGRYPPRDTCPQFVERKLFAGGVDPAAFQRRSLTCAVDGTGMLIGRFQLDPASGACLKAALA